MDWWEDGLCRLLAGRRRLVVRYDQRDTGRATNYPPGQPGYSGADLVSDAVAVLDGLGIELAHVVGMSMGGGIAQRLALAHDDRLASLTLISTTPIEASGEGLPVPTGEVLATFTDDDPAPDWRDREAVIGHIVEGERPFAGPDHFDEARLRNLAGRVFDRTSDIEASMTNHFLIEDGPGRTEQTLSRLAGLPTLVVHGTADPLFPLPHAHALLRMIPGARLIELEGVGHQLPPPPTWANFVDELIEHTARA